MSAARLEKLRVLLKRVEARAAEPRLHVVNAAQTARLSDAAPRIGRAAAFTPGEHGSLSAPFAHTDDSVPEAIVATASRVASPPIAAAPAHSPVALVPAISPPAAPASMPPVASAHAAPMPAAPPPSPPIAARANTPAPQSRLPVKSPLEDAMVLLRDEEFGDAKALSGPITMDVNLETPRGVAGGPSLPDPHLTVTHRPEASLSSPEVELLGIPPAPSFPSAQSAREPTLEFEVRPKAPVRGHEPLAALPESAPSAAQVEIASAPSQAFQAAALLNVGAPVRVVTPMRVEVAKNFGELLDLSLSLRPRVPHTLP